MEPLPHTPGKFAFFLRSIFDFQVITVKRHLKKCRINKGDKVLDVGAGLSPYKHLILESGGIYTGIDSNVSADFKYDNKEIIKYDGINIPFEDNSFDWIICTEVLEHVESPFDFTKELYRVGKNLFLTVPFSARFHYKPHDYFRFTPTTLTKMFSVFRDAEIMPRGNELTVISNKLAVFSLNYPIFILILPFSILLGYISLLGLGSVDDPLGYSVIAKK